jgi:hypothetical protein
MPNHYLPEADHVVRLVKPSLLMRDEDTNAVIGCFPQAFELREASEHREAERDLSVSWLEFFAGSKTERLQQVRNHAEMTLRPNHGFACLNVGEIHQTCKSVSVKVRIIHEPTRGNPAHAAIHRYPRDHDELFAILANIASQDLTLARDIPPSDPPT